jgi:hypothetical protein
VTGVSVKKNAASALAVYYIPGMGHGGTEYNNLGDGRVH